MSLNWTPTGTASVTCSCVSSECGRTGNEGDATELDDLTSSGATRSTASAAAPAHGRTARRIIGRAEHQNVLVFWTTQFGSEDTPAEDPILSDKAIRARARDGGENTQTPSYGPGVCSASEAAESYPYLERTMDGEEMTHARASNRIELTAELNVPADDLDALAHRLKVLGTLTKISDSNNWLGCDTIEILAWGGHEPLVRMDGDVHELHWNDVLHAFFGGGYKADEAASKLEFLYKPSLCRKAPARSR